MINDNPIKLRDII